MRKLSYEKILQDIDQFLQLCASIRLQESQGRFTQYRYEIAALMNAIKAGSLRGQSEKYLEKYRIALMEGAEIGTLLPYLQECDPVIIGPRIRDCLKGAFSASDEKQTSSHSRNIQFELLMARTLWRAGLQPSFGEPDLECQIDNTRFLFACKRLFSSSPEAIRKRIKEAAEQIQRNRKNHPPGTRGVIAISLSRVFNPEQVARLSLSEQQGRNELAGWLKEKGREVQDMGGLLLAKKVSALLFYAASPFDDIGTPFYTFGSHFVGFPVAPEEPLPGTALEKLMQVMKAVEY